MPISGQGLKREVLRMEVPQEPHLQHDLGQNGVPAMESLPEQSPLNRLIDPTQAMEVTETYTVPTSSITLIIVYKGWPIRDD